MLLFIEGLGLPWISRVFRAVFSVLAHLFFTLNRSAPPAALLRHYPRHLGDIRQRIARDRDGDRRNLPFSIAPTRSSHPIVCAPTVIADSKRLRRCFSPFHQVGKPYFEPRSVSCSALLPNPPDARFPRLSEARLHKPLSGSRPTAPTSCASSTLKSNSASTSAVSPPSRAASSHRRHPPHSDPVGRGRRRQPECSCAALRLRRRGTPLSSPGGAPRRLMARVSLLFSQRVDHRAVRFLRECTCRFARFDPVHSPPPARGLLRARHRSVRDPARLDSQSAPHSAAGTRGSRDSVATMPGPATRLRGP